MAERTIAVMRERLAVLAPLELKIEDESALHVGHAGAASGGGHYRMTLVSAAFAGQPRVARHRLVYDALADLMRREIHALAMTLLAPGEAPSSPAPVSQTSGH
ncbi:MAG TPA: BolA family protein [Burkholderiaceae bacterium]|nr:BolA family protein [Burkholderiaceae bacterium]